MQCEIVNSFLSFLQEAICAKAGHRIKFDTHSAKIEKKWLDFAFENAKTTLLSHLQSQQTYQKRFCAVNAYMGDKDYQRIACVDISHQHGQATYGSVVLFTPSGSDTKAYRKYVIKDHTPGDDYGAIDFVLSNYFSNNAHPVVDLLIIDGGKGQLHQAQKSLQDLSFKGDIISISKGEGRKAGLETIWQGSPIKALDWPKDHPGFLLLLYIRDSAHKAAITMHRKSKVRMGIRATLTTINGIGEKKRQTLIDYFGDLSSLRKASIEQIATLPGMSTTLAKSIHSVLNNDGTNNHT